ncbi:MAG: ATP-binding protein [Patescibacteria group bacterium]
MANKRNISDKITNENLCLQAAQVIIVVINRQSKVTLINDFGARFLGYKKEEIIGKNWFANFLPKRLRKETLTFSKQLLAGSGKTAEYHENEVLSKNGKEKLIGWHNKLLKDKVGKIVGHISSGEDISERKKTEEKISKLNSSLNLIRGVNQLILKQRDKDKLIEATLKIISQSREFTGTHLGIINDDFKIEKFYQASPREHLSESRCKFIYKPEFLKKVRSKKIVVVADVTKAPFKQHFNKVPKHSGMIGAIEHGQNLFGFLTVHVVPGEKISKEKISLFKEVVSDIGYALDNIEAEKKIKESELKFRSLFSSMNDLVFGLHKDGEFIFYHAPEDIPLLAEPREFLGKKFDKVLPKYLADLINQAFRENQKGKISEFKYSATISGREYWFLAKMSPFIIDNEFSGSVAVVRDITKLMEVDKMKSDFISLASHQMRTPLTTIKWFTEDLLNNNELNDRQREYLEEIFDKNDRLIDLVNGFLNVTRIESGEFVVDPKMINLQKLIARVIHDHEIEIKRNLLKVNVSYEKGLKKTFNLDEQLMHVIFTNVFDNATKYSNYHGKINIKVLKSGKNFKISVADNGQGIPRHDQTLIFQRMFRAENARIKHTSGTGLGLYIVKSILKQIGGKIWFTSKLNKGTTFYITLPLSGMKRKKEKKGLVV